VTTRETYPNRVRVSSPGYFHAVSSARDTWPVVWFSSLFEDDASAVIACVVFLTE